MDEALFFPLYEYQSAPVPRPIQHDHLQSTRVQEQQIQECIPGQQAKAHPTIDITAAGPSDDSVVREEPSRHVDYLSHDWKEEDIWASWRYMVTKRKVYSNSARLENASWRTWTKKKYNLKTVSPEKLNWLKDCDVTWLYGPLSTGAGKFSSISPASPPVSPVEPKIPQSGSFYKTKPILKKRSMSEVMLQRSLTTSSLLKQATAAIESQQLGAPGSLLQRPQFPSRVNSDNSLCSSQTTIAPSSQITPRLSTGCHSPSSTKHIHFNNRVQQCIAVEKADREEDDDEEEDDEFMCNGAYRNTTDGRISTTYRAKSNGKGEGSCLSERRRLTEPLTIAMLPPTTLKYTEEIPVKKTGSFMSFNSFFSGSRAVSSSPVQPQKSPFLDDDEDDDFSGLDWFPKSTSTTNSRNVGIVPSEIENDLQLPNYSYEEEDDDSTAEGLLGRAVDAVNTARDIAHVLWNVGWRR
ncbi:hypothetical protein EDC01DRAFT_616914 [Geopyxis carbonaria]|nr:hypothetical protein EDC01DRAFT_616914 [Geopyxis carbonaria]